MTEGNFVDYVKLHLSSGNGGKGSVHLRREKYVAMGGPDGGDGGRGGHVILKANSQLWTLYHLKFKRHFKAGHGEHGSKSRSTGADGVDVVIEVPLGTVVRDTHTNQVIYELTQEDETYIAVQGGKGGKGNWHFKNSVNQTPRYAQPGIEGTQIDITLELKVLADVGLVGFPNAGKSTLLSVLTSAKPKIADYEFTTLKPNLGIVKHHDFRTFVMADIPGIIEGAAEGKGIGYRFLRHIERNSILLFLIPCDVDDIAKQYFTLLDELDRYNPELLDKKRFIAISKCDILDQELQEELEKELDKTLPLPYTFISGVAHFGLEILKNKIFEYFDD